MSKYPPLQRTSLSKSSSLILCVKTAISCWQYESTGMAQAEVAEAAGLSSRTYADIERRTVNMRVETILHICEALHITPDEIRVGPVREAEYGLVKAGYWSTPGRPPCRGGSVHTGDSSRSRRVSRQPPFHVSGVLSGVTVLHRTSETALKTVQNRQGATFGASEGIEGWYSRRMRIDLWPFPAAWTVPSSN